MDKISKPSEEYSALRSSFYRIANKKLFMGSAQITSRTLPHLGLSSFLVFLSFHSKPRLYHFNSFYVFILNILIKWLTIFCWCLLCLISVVILYLFCCSLYNVLVLLLIFPLGILQLLCKWSFRLVLW